MYDETGNELIEAQSHSPFTRASTINVFRQVMRMLETVRDEHPQAVRQALKQIAPIWLQTFQQMLAADAAAEVSDNWEMLGIRIEILRVGHALPKLVYAEQRSRP